MIRAVRAVALLGALFVSTTARAGVADDLSRIDLYLHQWRIPEAVALAEQLYQQFPDVPAVQAQAGKVKFYQADYQGAVTLLERAAMAFRGGNDEAAMNAMDGSLLELVRATREATKGFIATESEHFSFRAPPGKDQILAPYALEALEAAYERIGTDFDHKPKEKIVIEVYPSARALAQVSTLTEKEIETSGTIAICKFNRLMITSPRALLRGYAWLDTLAHEYVHLIVSQKSHNTVGIWLHEGLAKFSESRWSGEAGEAMSLWQENLLAKAVQKDKLITFEQMHPSMAKLPSQHDTALAFAEVFTVVEYLHKGGPTCGRGTCPPGTRTGYAVTNAIIDRLRNGESDEEAIAEVLGADFDIFKKDWLRYLKARPQKHAPGAEIPKLKFKKGARSDDEDREDDVDEGLSPEVRRYARLGNLLRRNGRPRAAAMEYERAVRGAGMHTPLLHNRLASAYLESGDDGRALETLKEVERTFPEYAQTHIQMGRIHYKRGALAEARDSYLRANRQNPFNPEIHAALADIFHRMGDKALAEREATAYLALNRPVEALPTGLADENDPQAALLTLETTPWAQLTIDDIDVGLMTPVEVRLKPGRHMLRLKNPAIAVDRKLPIEVKPGDHARIRLNLTQP